MQATLFQFTSQYYTSFFNSFSRYAAESSQQYQLRPVGLQGANVLVVPALLASQQACQAHRPTLQTLETADQPAGNQVQPAVGGAAAPPARTAQSEQPSRQQPAGDAPTGSGMQWGTDMPAAVSAQSAEGPAAAVQRVALAALPNAKRVLLALIDRCTSGDLSAGRYAAQHLQTLHLFLSSHAQPESTAQRHVLEAKEQLPGDAKAQEEEEQLQGDAAEADCPMCGEKLAPCAYEEHVAAELQTVDDIEQQYLDAQSVAAHAPQLSSGRQQEQQQQQQSTVLHGMQELLDSVLASLKDVVMTAFESKQPSTALLVFEEGLWKMQVNAPTDIMPHFIACLNRANVGVSADPQVQHLLLQHIITTAKHLTLSTIFETLQDSESAAAEASCIDSAEKQKLYYIGGYLVSTLIVNHIKGLKQRHFDWAGRVNWLYVHCLEALKLERKHVDTIPADVRSYAESVDRGGLTYITLHMFEFLCEAEMIVRAHLSRQALRSDALLRLQDALQYKVVQQSLCVGTSSNLALFDKFTSAVFSSLSERVKGHGSLDFAHIKPAVVQAYGSILRLYVKVRIAEFRKVVTAATKGQRKEAFRRGLKGSSGSGPAKAASRPVSQQFDFASKWEQFKNAAGMHAALFAHVTSHAEQALTRLLRWQLEKLFRAYSDGGTLSTEARQSKKGALCTLVVQQILQAGPVAPEFLQQREQFFQDVASGTKTTHQNSEARIHEEDLPDGSTTDEGSMNMSCSDGSYGSDD